MRTAQQFSGSAWLSYDQAFRRQAAASKLNDWSPTHPELFHFYVSSRVAVEQPTVAAPVRSVSPTEPSRDVEAVEASDTPSAYSPLLERQSVFLLVLRCRFRRSCDFPGCSASHRPAVAHTNANSPASVPPFKRRRSLNVQFLFGLFVIVVLFYIIA